MSQDDGPQPHSIPSSPDYVSQDELMQENEEKVENALRSLKRSYTTFTGPAPAKSPMYYQQENSDEEEEFLVPNLAEYFSDFELAYEAQIKICRSYASYLSSQLPKKHKQK